MPQKMKIRKNAYSAHKTAEQNVRAGYRKHGGSYLATARDLDHLRNVVPKHSKAKKKFTSSELLALHKKARQVHTGKHKSTRYHKEYASYSRKEKRKRAIATMIVETTPGKLVG